MIRALIIDDESLARLLVADHLKAHSEIEIIGECADGFEGVKAISALKPDLIFLDIQMPRITGFEMLELIESPPAIIFTTAYDEFALKAFEAGASDYLLKPFSAERFDKAIEKFKAAYHSGKTNDVEKLISENNNRNPEESSRIVVKVNNAVRIIPISEVLYFEAFDDYVKIHTKESCFLKKKTLAYYEKSLPASDFIRVHRSYIIQIPKLTRIEQPEKDTHIALLTNGVKIPLSRSGYSRLKETLGI
ncbi:MAG: LytTR family transcriptional regulator DNA-binding domain-containing protein [Bacteroidia bacterium]|nr:LytTR family transcriptional regulator DNA-binding domain-containing protein [Bacteroidia bacterium]